MRPALNTHYPLVTQGIILPPAYRVPAIAATFIWVVASHATNRKRVSTLPARGIPGGVDFASPLPPADTKARPS